MDCLRIIFVKFAEHWLTMQALMVEYTAQASTNSFKRRKIMGLILFILFFVWLLTLIGMSLG